MDDRRFDALARQFGRRRLLHSMGLGLGAAVFSVRRASAAPALTLTPITTTTGLNGVRPGWKVRATVSGYLPGESISIRWFDGSAAETLKTFAADGSGAGTTTFIVPETYGGEHKVRARGDSGHFAEGALNVIPKLVIPTTGRRGQSVSARLTGFLQNQSVGMLWFSGPDSGSVPSQVTCIQVDATGTGVGSIPIPADATLGDHFVAPKAVCSARSVIMSRTGRTITVTCPSGFAPDGTGGCCRALFTSCTSNAQCCTGNCVSGKCRPILVF